MSSQGQGPVGSVGEEAAKLLGALQDWANEGWVRSEGSGAPTEAGAGLGAAFRHVDEHLATGDASCAYCPVCRLITRLHSTSPELRLHLAVAARSLLEAAAGLLETRVPPEPRRTGVQRIDLDDETPEGTDHVGGWDAE